MFKHLCITLNNMSKLSLFYLVFLLMLGSSCGNQNRSAESQTASKKDLNQSVNEDIKTIVFFGNSLTAGYGVEQSEAFPAIIQGKIDSLKLPYKIVNAGLSGETTSGGKNRIGWILKNRCDIFVLELGANDGLRGIPVSETTQNLQEIVDQVVAKNPQVKLLLAGMQVPPNMGGKYASDFNDLFPSLAKKNNMALVPFLLEGVAGNSDLNQSDGIHPTVKGHKILADNVWKIIQPVL